MPDTLAKITRIKRTDYQFEGSILIEAVSLNENFKLHWHDHYELEYFVSGSGIHLMNGKEYEIRPGTLHFVVPSDFHSITVIDSMTIIKIVFDESDISSAVYNQLAGLSPHLNLQLTDTDKTLFDTLFGLCASEKTSFFHTDSYPALTKNLLESILLHLVEHCKANALYQSAGTVDGNDISSVLTYLQHQFRKPITLASTAEIFHFSPTYFSKRFHQSVGITFKEYLSTLRLQFAAKLLANTDCPITEVCYESGFGSLSRFINAFHNAYNMSPSAYRKQFRKQ